MTSINVQELDRSICKMGQRFIKRTLDQAGKTAVERVVMGAKILEDLRAVKSSVRVASPCIHCITPRIQFQSLNGLAKSAIGITAVRPKFYKGFRFQHVNQEHGKRDMLVPGRKGRQATWQTKENRKVHGSHCSAASRYVLPQRTRQARCRMQRVLLIQEELLLAEGPQDRVIPRYEELLQKPIEAITV